MQIYYEFYKAIKKSSPENLPKSVEFYLYEMLLNPKITKEPIALLIYQSIESEQKENILKKIADSSLIHGSIFPNRGISKDYYISISSYGYGELNKIKRNKTFEFLSQKTKTCAIILEKAAEALSSPCQMW